MALAFAAAGLCLTIVSNQFITPQTASASAPSRYFSTTGQNISGSFLDYFDRNGGVRVFGYPITPAVTENGRQVQYFERQRFELHSEYAGSDYQVLLGRLGASAAPASELNRYAQPFAPSSNRVYFTESRHSLSGAFLGFWKANGSIRILGYPVTEPFTEGGYLVQYFERARMEYHPEKAGAGYGVELGLLGKRYLDSLNSRGVSPVSRGGAQPLATEQAPALSAKEARLWQLIADARKGAGVQAVGLDTALRGVALARSRDMVARNYFSHTTPDGQDFLSILKGSGVAYQYAGEIIANNNFADDQTADQAFSSFINSPHHRDILLDPRYNISGIGEATNSSGFHYFTVIFVQR
jgi:uncharacterized protein YkwD